MNVGKSKPVAVLMGELTHPKTVAVVGNNPAGMQDLLRIPSNTPYIRRNVAQRHAMALGDMEGTLVEAFRRTGKDKMVQAQADLVLQKEIHRMQEDIYGAANYLEQTIGTRRTVKSLYDRLNVIQKFNEAMTGRPQPIHIFFPNALSITLFATNHLKMKPGKFRAVTPDDRWVFTGLVQHYMENKHG